MQGHRPWKQDIPNYAKSSRVKRRLKQFWVDRLPACSPRSSIRWTILAFIARSPFVIVASCDAAGRVDTSPKGDPAGFVHVLDRKTIAIPERPGNRRADTFRNVLQNPRVGLIFIVPGKGETLRVSGTASIARDAWLRERMAVADRVPDLALVVKVEEAFVHCTKCMVRSRMWQPDTWNPGGLASSAEAVIAHGRVDMPVEVVAVFRGMG
jgi:PPOX class probable FMN-dependent enzyme